MTRFDVAPPVADHVAARQVQDAVRSRTEEQSGLGLPAGTRVGVVVWTGTKVLESERIAETAMYRLDDLRRGRSAGDVRLVGDHDEREPQTPQSLERLRYARQDLDLLYRFRWPRDTVRSDKRAIQDAVAIEKDRC